LNIEKYTYNIYKYVEKKTGLTGQVVVTVETPKERPRNPTDPTWPTLPLAIHSMI